jgi:uncharacterized repeat protein (TIGR03803 family)
MKKLRTFLLAMNLAAISLAAPWAQGAISGTTFTTLAAFNNTNSGANPYAPPVLGADGNLYGALPYGGTNSVGVIFKVGTNASEITLHAFSNWDGAYPDAQLTAGQDGNFYGVASGGGTNKLGTIFEVTTNGTFTLLYSFGMMTNALGYALDGSSPYGGMVQGRDGNFYGTTYSGGITNAGTVFQFATNGTLTTLHSFIGNGTNDEGANPYTAPLVEGADGIFYGTTSTGGTNNDGTIFQITAAGALTTLFEFNKTNGLNPYAGLSYSADGKLYGTTVYGGTNNEGTAFQITTNGVLTTLFQFGGTNGSYPEGGVVPGLKNVLYGTAYSGGVKGYGTVFQLTTNGQLTTLYAFTNGSDGANPYAGVIHDASANLYGACLYGGKNGGYGTIYRWNDPTRPTNSITLPTTGQRWSNSVFTASGKASDNVAVADVFYSLNGSGWIEAATSNRWATWTAAPLTLTPGTNLLQSYSMDYSGNLSVTSSVNFDFVVTNQLTLRTVGLGTINPNYSNAWLEIGRNYSVTSAPASGFIFTNWLVTTNGIGGALVTGTNLQFTMHSNLTLQANFVDVAAPKITITTPTQGQKMTNALATVVGTATDNWQVSNVWYQLNGGAWNAGMTANKYTNWTSALLKLIAGTNSVNAYASDFTGNLSVTSSVSFISSNTFKLQMNFAQAQPLTATGLNFSLQISPGLNGHIQASTNLANWITLTNFVGSNTTLNFRDPAATNSSRRFYRAVIP